MKKNFTTLLFAIVAMIMPIGAWAQDATIEALWGASAESLTHSGTLQEAFKAAELDHTIGYIQVQSDITADYVIYGGKFTLDLNGYVIQSDSYTLDVRNEGTNLTLVDNYNAVDRTGKVISDLSGASAIIADAGTNLTILSGCYEATSMAAYFGAGSSGTILGGIFKGGGSYPTILTADNSTLTIAAGDFGGTDFYSAVQAAGNITITGGVFAEGLAGTISYANGLLDFSQYPTTTTEKTMPITDFTIFNTAEQAVVSLQNFALPEGYCLRDYYQHDIVSQLEYAHRYVIGSDKEQNAVITGLTITVDGVEYGVGDTAIITPNTTSIIYTVTGENFINASEKNYVIFTRGINDIITSGGWTIDAANNTATYDFSSFLHWFESNIEPFEIMYSNDGCATRIGSGVYILYKDQLSSTLELTDRQDAKARKIFRNGQIIIIRDGVEYTVMGMPTTNH